MLLGNRKTQSPDQNWCIILSPLRSELDKKRVAQKISEVFSLSSSESSDLVSNTPIILLDNLSRPMAARVKDFFQASGAEMILTNDVFMKRKCYRTVWPEPPNLSFLHELETAVSGGESAAEDRQVMAPQEALDFMSRELPQMTSTLPSRDGETDRWKHECELAREEAARLRGELAKKAADRPDNEKGQLKDKEIRELKSLLTSTQEKYDAIKDEYREARVIFEEKMTAAMREFETLKTRSLEAESRAESAAKEKRDMEESVRWGKGNFHKLSEEYERARKTFEDRLDSAARELERTKEEAARLNENLDTLRGERQALERALDEKDKRQREALDEAAQLRRGFEEKLAFYVDEMEQWKIKTNQSTEAAQMLEQEKKSLKDRLDARDAENRRLEEKKQAETRQLEQRVMELEKENQRLKIESGEMGQKAGMLEKVRENLERLVREESAEAARLREKYEALSLRVEQVDRQVAEEKEQREKIAHRERELEKTQLRLIQELDNRKEDIFRWESRFSSLEAELGALRQTLDDREKMLKANLDLLDGREKELEAARRQVRDLNQQLEQRETIQKKNHLSTQLAEKEARFKKLVADQEKIEQEMRQKEETMRQVLAEQEAVEKEIMEAKQAQRYLIERAKRERPLSARLKSNSGDAGKEPAGDEDSAETAGE